MTIEKKLPPKPVVLEEKLDLIQKSSSDSEELYQSRQVRKKRVLKSECSDEDMEDGLDISKATKENLQQSPK